MNEIYELNFHGNRQEIENEKQRKRELMSYFPKTLGTFDETKYVLQDDDKPGAENHYDKMNFAPSPTVISNRSEKSNGQQSKPTTSVPCFENSRKNIDFESWKGNTTFLEPKKENAVTTTAPKSPFDFDGNSTREENSSFSTAIQFPGLRSVGSNKPRTTTARNDSLRLRTDKMENIADSLKRGNVNYNRNTDLNNAPTAKRDVTPGLYGENPNRDYTEDLRKVKQNLPAIALDILNNSGIKIIVLDNLHSVTKNGKIIKRTGRYFADKKKIYLDSKNVDEYTLISEIFHAAQDKLGMTGVGKSNLEFQEHVIKDLYFKKRERKSNNYDNSKGLSTTDDDNYANFIEDVLNEDGILDFNKFQKDINFYFDKFQKYYSGVGAYQEPGIANFNYNWKMILDLFGIKYK